MNCLYQDERLIPHGTEVLDNHLVTYRKKQVKSRIRGGYFHFEEVGAPGRVYGFGHGDYIRLRDEQGNTWSGSAELGADDSVRYRFQDSAGQAITGISDTWGLILRGPRGRTWRGFIE